MLKKFLLGIVLLSFLFTVGCATMIRVKLLKPSEIDIGGIKKVAVLDVDVSNSTNYDRYIATNCSSEIITSKLIQKIVDNGHFTVIGNTRQNEILSGGFWFLVKGHIDNQKIQDLGRKLGVDALIIASASCNSEEQKIWTESTDNVNGVTLPVKKFRIERDVRVDLNYKIIETTNARVLGFKEITDNSKSTSTTPYTGQVLQEGTYGGTYIMLGIEVEEKKARLEFPDLYLVLDNLNESVTNTVIKQIAPHFEIEEREIKSGDSDLMKQAIEFSKNDLLDKARTLWEDVLNTPSLYKDHISAMYNIGIYYEVNGNFEKAKEYFMQCFSRTNDSKYLKDISRIKQRQDELLQLRKQGKDADY